MIRNSCGTELKFQKSKEMKLNIETAKATIISPESKQQINDVKNHESQLRVFTEVMSENELASESYWQTLMSKMKKRSDKKFDRVKEFARFPLPVVQLSDSILNDFFKVFDGKNKYFNYDSNQDVKLLSEWMQESEPAKWIEKHAQKVFKNKPNSFVVLDYNEAGKPYLIFIDSSRLVDAKFKDDEGNLEYISFIHSIKKHETKANVTTTFFSVYDDETFFVFKKDSDNDSVELVSQESHFIGYCPAKSFIKTATSKNLFKRRVAFSSALSKFEDWTLFDIYRNYVDHYAPFPVTEAPMKKCPNPDCQGGKVSEVITEPRDGTERTIWKDCTACGGSDGGQHIFPGTHIGIKVQSDKSLNDGSGVFKMIFPDTDKLKYVPEKLNELETEIRLKSVGINTMTSEAFNELQVKGSFVSMESILIRTKEELDVLFVWIVETASRMIYKNISISVESNFGTEFYLVSEDDLQKRFENAKKIGLPVEEQLNIYRQLIETKYKGNAQKMKKNLMLLDLDPFPMLSIKECVDLKSENVVDDFDLSLKVNLLKFISKFETENGSILSFGSSLEYWQRIEIIKTTLNLYNQELINEKQARNNPQGTEGEENEPKVTQEQLDAQANLRGSVGGVQGILGIVGAVSANTMSKESAIATMIEIYGFNRETALQILGVTEN